MPKNKVGVQVGRTTVARYGLLPDEPNAQVEAAVAQTHGWTTGWHHHIIWYSADVMLRSKWVYESISPAYQESQVIRIASKNYCLKKNAYKELFVVPIHAARVVAHKPRVCGDRLAHDVVVFSSSAYFRKTRNVHWLPYFGTRGEKLLWRPSNVAMGRFWLYRTRNLIGLGC